MYSGYRTCVRFKLATMSLLGFGLGAGIRFGYQFLAVNGCSSSQ